MNVLVSAGEASGEIHASAVVSMLAARHPEWRFFGCAGPKLRAAGVRPVMDAEKLHVVGLAEVVTHIPGIWLEYRKLLAAVDREKPDLAVLTDSPDFNLRVARQLARRGVPVVYLVAPQAWAWRAGRVKAMRRDLRKLLCIFPFEEAWFRQRGVDAVYVGHPLAHLIQATETREEFRARHGLCPAQPLVAVLPGSRPGVIARHAPAVTEAIARLEEQGAQCVIGLPSENTRRIFVNQTRAASIQQVVGETWNLLNAADVALSASGTVTMEAALLGTPMVTFYRVNAASWLAGKLLVKTPFYTMVNLIAEKKIVPELMQDDATGENLAREVSVLLNDGGRRQAMRDELNEVARRLRTGHDPMEKSALIVEDILGIRNA